MEGGTFRWEMKARKATFRYGGKGIRLPTIKHAWGIPTHQSQSSTILAIQLHGVRFDTAPKSPRLQRARRILIFGHLERVVRSWSFPISSASQRISIYEYRKFGFLLPTTSISHVTDGPPGSLLSRSRKSLSGN